MRVLVGLVLLCTLGVCVAAAAVLRGPIPPADWFADPVASFMLAQGENPSPVPLRRPAAQPLSLMAQLGKNIFYDASLSSSGQVACATCHSPQHHYGPPGDLSAVLAGPHMTSQGVRAVPSLMYLDHEPNFSIGPDAVGDDDAIVPLPQLATRAKTANRVTKTAQSTAQSATNIVPQGGMFWDGRADTLQSQAMGPLLSPYEMDGGSIERVAQKLQAAPYADKFTVLFGPLIFESPRVLVSEALFAVARYQIEDPSFHLYTSKYDYWLEGRAKLSAAEMRGYILFNDPAKGDCAACHVDQPSPDGMPPLFTDHQFEALGVPRNPKLMANADPAYYDLGICGPYRTDLSKQTQFCGMFLTPTLRNAATRQVFFHNGMYHDLREVLDFYDLRDTNPEKIYPRGADGKVQKFNDLPKPYQANIDRSDPPLDRELGEAPALSPAEETDIIAFLKTLTDGYKPDDAKPAT